MIEIGKDINKSVYYLENNKIVVLPTETVYGMGANALNKEAVKTIFKINATAGISCICNLHLS